MPILGWFCPSCKSKQPLDHYQKSECGKSVCPPDYAAALLKTEGARYVRGAVTVTQGLGCPRQTAIQEAEPYWVDPLALNAMETGHAWHAHMEQASLDPSNTEVELSGVIEGMKVRGRADRLIPPDTAIDYKHKNDFARKYIKGIEPEHMAQLSIYAELCEQSKGWRPTQGIVWYHFASAPGFIAAKGPLISLDEALSVRPHSGNFTVRELYAQGTAHFVGRQPWQEMPMAGEDQMLGKKALCEWCSVKDICWTQAKGAPF